MGAAAGRVSPSVSIGVLAVQGDVREHAAVLTKLGAAVRLVRRAEELDEVDGLVIPGGESTVIDKLTRAFGLRDPLRLAISRGMPIYGTCAGLIMLANTLEDAAPGQQTLGGIDAVVRRNAFGSQLDSFEEDIVAPEFGSTPLPAVFIRAPIVESVGPAVSILGKLGDGRIVAVRQDHLLGTSFHPEVTADHRVHEYFLGMVTQRQQAHAG